MITCGYYSETKHESCDLPKGHESKCFDYGADQRPMLFSVKKFMDSQVKVRKTKPARHVCLKGCQCKYRVH